MSRCFRFPPPGYKKILEEEKGSVVIIKRERDQAEKERRKEKKREKKEQKKREKIEKKKREKIEKLGANGEVEKKKQSHKEEGGHTEHKVTLCKEMKECEIEQLERSDLSEEHGQPAGILNLCDSSDSTQKSRKRKNRSLPSDGNHNQRGTEIIAQKMADISSNLTIKQPCLDSGRIEIAVQDSVKHAAVAKLSTRKSITPQTDVQLRETLDNWVPSAVQFEQMDAENLEWLFDMPPSKHEAKRSKVSDGASCRENPSLWPRACYLPEVDIYALPYTVPY
ncbi:hypothetical protein IFM89_002601 [Coptis chinensis]|uniref:Uncharacterized protein n=1 Tax=Coptis chinensis TaxID=261450 RepID=A0A835GTS4_9MAGN|nr:hypothetical protein IFM89_002601 [Coptis chinensis]